MARTYKPNVFGLSGAKMGGPTITPAAPATPVAPKSNRPNVFGLSGAKMGGPAAAAPTTPVAPKSRKPNVFGYHNRNK